MKAYDLVIVGGGPAGLAAAVSARDHGIESILIIERDKELGGILNQCIHNGFGLHTFKEELTGPEYAARFADQVRERQIEYKLNTMVMDISQDKKVTAVRRLNNKSKNSPDLTMKNCLRIQSQIFRIQFWSHNINYKAHNIQYNHIIHQIGNGIFPIFSFQLIQPFHTVSSSILVFIECDKNYYSFHRGFCQRCYKCFLL